jgi:hypothetical protein
VVTNFRLGSVGAVLAATAATIAAVAYADATTPDGNVRMSAPGRTHVTARLTRDGDGEVAGIAVRGVRAGAPLAASVQPGTCADPGLERASAGAGRADAAGAASWHAPVLAGARPLAWRTARDGRHVLVVRAAGSMVACGPVPATRDAGDAPRGGGHWGVWSFAGPR